MFSLITNCCSWARKVHEPLRSVTLLILGLGNAGKTTIFKGIRKESPFCTTPTLGFARSKLMLDRFEVTLFDLGGGEKFRTSWRNFYAETHGVVFVVDSTDVKRTAEAGNVLSEVLKHPKISGKPVLVLANKQDKAEALSESDIVEQISLGKLANENKSMCRIEPCSGTLDYAEKKLDRTVLRGLRWLLWTIARDYAHLSTRLIQDSAGEKGRGQQPERVEGASLTKKIQRERKRKAKVAQQKQQPTEPETLPRSKLSTSRNINNVINAQNEEKIKKLVMRRKKKMKLRFGTSSLTTVETRKLSAANSPILGSRVDTRGNSSTAWKRKSKWAEGNALLESPSRESKMLLSSTVDLESNAASSDQKKKKKKKVAYKNKINSADSTDRFSRNVDLTAPLDLYRKALLALKTRPRANV